MIVFEVILLSYIFVVLDFVHIRWTIQVAFDAGGRKSRVILLFPGYQNSCMCYWL